jgi:hypothetical protein
MEALAKAGPPPAYTAKTLQGSVRGFVGARSRRTLPHLKRLRVDRCQIRPLVKFKTGYKGLNPASTRNRPAGAEEVNFFRASAAAGDFSMFSHGS